MVYGAAEEKARRNRERLGRKESRRVTLGRIAKRHEKLVNQSDEAGIEKKLNLAKARRWHG